jgi:hypothetical protein
MKSSDTVIQRRRTLDEWLATHDAIEVAAASAQLQRVTAG